MRVYLDNASAKKVDPGVVEAMSPWFDRPVNPSSLHTPGQEAREALEEARERVAGLVNARPEEIIFTGGATESNNLALKGVALRARKGSLVASAIEHISILNTLKELSTLGFPSTLVPVDGYGVVDPASVESAITRDTVLVSVMAANSEIGTIQSIREIGEIVREKGVYFHVDATAALGEIPVDVERDHIDLLTFSSNSIYGPPGVGALYVRRGVKLQPIIQGGGQERGFRSGTENIPGIVGMARAAEITRKKMESESRRLKGLRDRLIRGVLEIEESYLTGHPERRLPGVASFRFSYVEGESIILSLDMLGISASTGSACTSKTLQPSHVLLALGLKPEEAHGSLLLTLGRWNTLDEIDYTVQALPGVIKRLREMSPLH